MLSMPTPRRRPGAEEHGRRMLAGPVVGPGEAAFDEALVDRIEGLPHADHGARRQHFDRHLAVGEGPHVVGERIEHDDFVRLRRDHRLHTDPGLGSRRAAAETREHRGGDEGRGKSVPAIGHNCLLRLWPVGHPRCRELRVHGTRADSGCGGVWRQGDSGPEAGGSPAARAARPHGPHGPPSDTSVRDPEIADGDRIQDEDHRHDRDGEEARREAPMPDRVERLPEHVERHQEEGEHDGERVQVERRPRIVRFVQPAAAGRPTATTAARTTTDP